MLPKRRTFAHSNVMFYPIEDPNLKRMNSDSLDNIKKNVNSRFELGGTKLENTHYENGQNLHSEQYYYAKRFFQNSDNCLEISKLLCSKLRELNLPNSTTLIGFRNYIGLLLNKAINELGKYNYALIEHDNSKFIWQHLPILNDNLIIILPITCTCSTYIKLRKFITDYTQEHFSENNSSVINHFINVFLILEKELEKQALPLSINKLEKDNSLYKIYSAFNWEEIQKSSIIFNNKTTNKFTAHPLVKLYSKLYLPESCELCFPLNDIITTEKPLFPTHDNYESPNLIFGFPNFSKVIKPQSFYESLSSRTPSAPYDIHLYGHTVVKSSHYMSYIQGDEFYEKNKNKILAFFSRVLKRHLNDQDKRIIFITTENKHNSNFLEDICFSDSLVSKSVTILRFEQSSEFIDNFISLHGSTINDLTPNENGQLKVIYFEEVISAGMTFKLLSDYIKHSRNDNPDITDRHGFDLVISLVDRTLLYTYHEILKKIKSKINRHPEENFISYFKLNVPIISASHMGNPIVQRIDDLKLMVGQSHLDSLKLYIAKEVTKQKPKNIHELQQYNRENITLSYFPFGKLSDAGENDVFNLYKLRFNKKQLDLLKLFVAHEINSELADSKYQLFNSFGNNPADFINNIIEILRLKNEKEISNFFVEELDINSPIRNEKRKEIEFEIFHDTIIKTLTRHPFIYYKSILESIFAYNLLALDELHTKIEKEKIRTFDVFRKLKFLIRRSIELNSNFIISKRFIGCIKNQYNTDSINKIMTGYKNKQDALKAAYDKGKIEKAFYNVATNNLEYKIKQVATYFLFLLYCYKELIYKNPYRSIKLEELINSPELLPYQITSSLNTDEELITLIHDPYFHFTGMIKAENIYLLNELKELHKRNIMKPNFDKIKDYADYYLGMKRGPTNHHDPIIINANKLVKKSRFTNIADIEERRIKVNEIKTAIGKMLKTVSLLEFKKSKINTQNKVEDSKHNLISEIKDILNSVMSIIQPGIPLGSLKYAFFVEFKDRNISTENTNNIFTIFSDDIIDNQDSIELNKHGLIYNMLYGLYDCLEAKNPQSLIPCVKIGTRNFYSFKEKYFVELFPNSDLDERTFENLYKSDLSESKNGSGIKILDDANMSLVFRLSNLTEDTKNKVDYLIKGQAVLLITSNQECNTTNFLNFMSNEKVRLLLLIKEELLDYLNKQFDNDAFFEVLESKKRDIYQMHLKHGIGDNTNFQKLIVDEYEKIEKKVNIPDKVKEFEYEFDKEIIKKASFRYKEFVLINKSISSQSGVFTKKDESKRVFFYDYFVDIINTIYKSIRLGGDSGDSNYKKSITFLNNNKFGNIRIPVAVLNCVIPEIIINQKKYGKNRKINWIETNTSLELIFSNELKGPTNKEGYGLKMCKEIKKLYNNSIIIEIPKKPYSDNFTLKLKIQKSGKENINS